jgi:transposase InsO family protein
MGDTFEQDWQFFKWSCLMPWKVESPMSLRLEFVVFASRTDANISLLCRRFKISRKTGYKWLARHRADPAEVLEDRSRRSRSFPARTEAAIEDRVADLRLQHPAWGARKLKRRLEDLGHRNVPARSTVNDILHRRGLIDPQATGRSVPFKRFERKTPNELWQMDFKGYLTTASGQCHPLTILDDCSRFNILLRACGNQQTQTVRSGLIDAMRQYGMPACILADNGTPWGSCNPQDYWTQLGVWLIRLGVRIIHGRPYHPQTQGKEERFHRTLKAEVIGTRRPDDLPQCQHLFDQWRPIYNHQRPHQALDMQTPASRYRPSPRIYPEVLPAIEYADQDQVRRVNDVGQITFKGAVYRVGTAFIGQPVALRSNSIDGRMKVFYCHQCVAEIDLRQQIRIR